MLIFTFSISYFTFIYGPNIPGSYAILLFIVSGFTFTSRHIHNWVSCLLWPSHSFFLALLVIALCSSPVAYWTPYDLGESHLQVSYLFAFSYGLCGSPGKNIGVGFHFLLQWITFCLNFSLCMICPSWVALHGMSHWVMQAPSLWQGPFTIHEGGTENIWVYARGCGFVSTQVSKQLNETDSMLLCNISMSFISELNQGESHFGRTSV